MNHSTWTRIAAVAAALQWTACAAPLAGESTDGHDAEHAGELVVSAQELKTRDTVTDLPALGTISVGPLTVCLSGTAVNASTRAQYEPWIRDAIRKWVEAIRPASNVYLHSDVTFSCVPPYDLVVGLYTGGGRAFASTFYTVLYEDDTWEDTVLHEFGHLFGADDTYLEPGDECQDDQPDSVMCPADVIYMNPQPDDILSVQEAFCYAQPSKCNRRWSSSANWCGADGHELHLGDFNGDTRQDMLCHRVSDGYKWIAFATSSGSFAGTSWEYPLNWCVSGDRLMIGDFNGDDRDDLLCHSADDGMKWIAHSTSSGTFTGTTWHAPNNWCGHQGAALYLGDFNGDNRDDMLCHDVYTGYKWISHATYAGNFNGTSWESNMNGCVLPGVLSIGRFNQDNRDDLLCHDLNSGAKYISFATGSGTFTGTSWSAALNWCNDTAVQVGDVDGDGREDMICHDRNSGRNWISLAKADGSFAGTTRVSLPDQPLRCNGYGQSFMVGDLNGDSAADFLCHDSTNGSKNVFYQSTLR
jgi:hypothetical protein